MYDSCILQDADTAMDATVAERGQITLPKAVRDALGETRPVVIEMPVPRLSSAF